jgi:hypothetical protein
VQKLDVMRKEEEDKQRRLHLSGHTFFWDITELKSIRFRMAILYVDILIFHYCNAANYEGRKGCFSPQERLRQLGL